MSKQKGLEFIHKNMDSLNKNVSSAARVITAGSITARYFALEKISKEWTNIKEDEVPLTKLHDFNWARVFLKKYMVLLMISRDFLIEQAEKSGEPKKDDDIFHIRFTNGIPISTMVSKGVRVGQELDHSSLEKIIDKYGLEQNINIKSAHELRTYIDLYSGTSEEEIEKQFINDVEQFKDKINSINDIYQ